MNVDAYVDYWRKEGYGYKRISKMLNYRVSHMGVKRHLKALESKQQPSRKF